MSEEFNRIAMMRAIRELESMEPKPFIAVKRSTNRGHDITKSSALDRNRDQQRTIFAHLRLLLERLHRGIIRPVKGPS